MSNLYFWSVSSVRGFTSFSRNAPVKTISLKSDSMSRLSQEISRVRNNALASSLCFMQICTTKYLIDLSRKKYIKIRNAPVKTTSLKSDSMSRLSQEISRVRNNAHAVSCKYALWPQSTQLIYLSFKLKKKNAQLWLKVINGHPQSETCHTSVSES